MSNESDVNIPKTLREKELNKLLLLDATVDEWITQGMIDLETDIPLYQLPQRKIPREQLELYRRVMHTLVKKTNQNFYQMFKLNKGIDIIPVYISYDDYSHSVRLHMNRNFLKDKLKADIIFPMWLRSDLSLNKGIKHRYRKAKRAEEYLRILAQDPNGREAEKMKPKWWNQLHKQFLKEYGSIKEYKPEAASNVNRSTKQHGRGLPLSRTLRPFEQKYEVVGNEIKRFSQEFSRPTQWDSLKKVLENDNFIELFGDSNQKSYLNRYKINTKIYNSIIHEVLKVFSQTLMNIQMRHLDERFVSKYESSYQPDFPNINKIRDWYVKKGIFNADNNKHYYTMENFRRLKSNTARANFIDRATIVIANSIYAKSIGEETSKITDDPYSPIPFRKGLTSGKKVTINKARRYKKFSKTRNKYQTKRTKKYSEWKLDNRKLASNLKRMDTRSRRQT